VAAGSEGSNLADYPFNDLGAANAGRGWLIYRLRSAIFDTSEKG